MPAPEKKRDPRPGDLLRTQDVAEILGVSEMTVRRYVADGALACVRMGRARDGAPTRRRMRFTRAHVDDFVNKRQTS